MKEEIDYLDPRCTRRNLDIFVVRFLLLRALKLKFPQLEGRLLDVGCGEMPYRKLVEDNGRVSQYLGLDFVNSDPDKVSPDLVWDGQRIPLDDESVDSALATELFEHCPDTELVMKEICRVLKPGGKLLFSTPFFYPLHIVPHDYYRFTPFALERHLSRSGFEQIDISAYGGWKATLALAIGVWLRKGNVPRWPKAILSTLSIPLLSALCMADSPPERFIENTMMPGLVGIATKAGV